jgi:hypothetical protein
MEIHNFCLEELFILLAKSSTTALATKRCLRDARESFFIFKKKMQYDKLPSSENGAAELAPPAENGKVSLM